MGTAQVIDGRALAREVEEEVRARVEQLAAKGVTPRLVAVVVGDDPASASYVRGKEKACRRVGIASETMQLPEGASESEILETVFRLNEDPTVHGVLVQFPLPGQIDVDRVVEGISPLKDVDCLHPENLGRLFRGRPRFIPCTPAGVLRILKNLPVNLAGADVTMIGRSLIVGKPLSFLLTGEDATVTLCHSKTRGLAAKVSAADVVIVAVGQPRFLPGEWVRPGAVVIDVGANLIEGHRLVGDVDFDNALGRASFITPVPGGVGPMTVAMLLKNVVDATELQSELSLTGRIT